MERKKTIVGWVLRIAVAGEFVGHGAFAILGKADWVGWIQQFGVADPVLAKQLLLGVGIIDVIAAVVMLVRPFPAILLGAAFWAFWTALVRPLVGLPVWDFIERSANWGAPLALLFLFGGWPRTLKEWFSCRESEETLELRNGV
jgi:hypothetical protein